MHRRADIIRFAVAFFALSALLGWLVWSSTSLAAILPRGARMLAVPIVSAMLAAVGFSWRRKIVYVAATIGVYLVSGAIAGLAGLPKLASEQLSTSASFPPVWINLYLAFLTTFPFVMLVLFVGRTPALLWSRRAD